MSACRSTLRWLWLFALMSVVSALSVAAAEQVYVVKRGDSLFGIASKRGISVDDLAERNGLSRSQYLSVGQRLILPGKPGKKSAKSSTPLPASVQKAIDRAPVKAGRWKYIVVHHSGVDTGTMAAMDRYHREVRHMENGLAYDFVIGNGDGMGDGEIGVSRRWTQQLDGGHLASEAQNKIALGICLVGNFDEHPPSARQMAMLRALTKALMARCKIPPESVKTHQQINIVSTRCPGSKFPAASFLESLRPAVTSKD